MHVTWFTLCRMSLSPKKLKELCDTPTNNDYGSQVKYGENCDEAPHVGPASIWALGLTVVIGGQYFIWNCGLAAGFGSQLIAVVLMGFAYICLCLCNAELTSSFLFAGGAYGINRITCGLYPGFLIGCCEGAQYITYVAISTYLLSKMLRDIWHTEECMVPIFCLLFYISACSILIFGERYFWRFSALFGVSSLLILLIYCFGSLAYVNIARNTPHFGTTGSDFEEDRPQWFVGGMVGFMKFFPVSAWFFVGVESINLFGSVVAQPKTGVPIASIWCIVTCFFTSLFVLFVCASLPMLDNIPTAQLSAPMSVGFALMFKMRVSDAIVFSLPATYATCYGFTFAFSRILISMSQSGLLPPILKHTYGKHKAPYAAIIAGSALGYCLCLAMYFKPPMEQQILPVCSLSSFIAYISQFIGYLIFKKKYGHYAKTYTSPIGIWGAGFGGAVFSLGVVAICAFQDDYVAFITTLFLGVFCTIYYYTYAKRRQIFSEEEKVFFPMQILKFNIHKNHSARMRSKKAGPSISCLLLSPSLKKPNPDSTLIPLDILPVKMPRRKLRTLPGPLLPAVVVSSPIMSENESLESYSSVV